MNIKDLPFGSAEQFNMVVEIPQGSQDKFEYDEKLDIIKLDRVLYGSQRFPANYGFVPETRAEDGDHTDVVLLSTNPLPSGTLVVARAIGFMEMLDAGEVDNKIIAVPAHDPRFDDTQTLEDLSQHKLKEIENFFVTYKILQKKTVEVRGFQGSQRAKQELETTHQVYQKENSK